MPDIPNDLELNQEDFSDVLPRLPDDLQDFDLFEGTVTCDYMTAEYRRDLRAGSVDLGPASPHTDYASIVAVLAPVCQSPHVFFSRKCKNLLVSWHVCTLSELSLWIQVRMESCCPPQRRQRS